ncbi:MAG: hypothetical protein WCJ51_04055, partial [Candidatus Moraniibacteriota bacterium]
MKQGKFVAIYGINGIGKTTQVDLLVKYLKSIGKKASRLKYQFMTLSQKVHLFTNICASLIFATKMNCQRTNCRKNMLKIESAMR